MAATSAGRGRGASEGVQLLVLFLACFIIFGNYYCYDLPGALNKPLRERLGLSQEAFVYPLNLLYAVYSVPNTVLPLVGGWLLDRFGVRRILHVLAALVCVGQAVFALGIERASIAVMLVGRLLFGLGGESLGE